MNITQRINIFFREVWVEMRRVSWLSRKDIIKYTIIVLGVTAAVAAFLGGLDYIFTEIIRLFVLK